MAKKKLQNVKFIEVELLMKTRFDFVENKTLRENIAINMQYIAFLYSLENEYDLPGAVTYSVFKTIIVFTASIIESLINYKLRLLVSQKKIKETDIMGSETIYQCFKKKEYPISPTETIMAGIKKISKVKKLEDDTILKTLNKAAKRSGLFNQKLFDKSEQLREKRNNIHLTALNKVEDQYTQEEIDKLFKDAKEIIDRIRDYEI